MAKKKVPNPGSDAAIARGCTCPVLDNHHGMGMGETSGSPLAVPSTLRFKHQKRRRQMIKIDKTIPLPGPVESGRPAKYPVSRLRKGHSFLVTTPSERASALVAARRIGIVATSRAVAGGFRIWRVM